MHVVTPARNWAEVHNGTGPAVFMFRLLFTGEHFFIVCWEPESECVCYQGYTNAWAIDGLMAHVRPARGEDFPVASVTFLREGESIGEFEASISCPLRELVSLPHDGDDWERIDTAGHHIQFEPGCIHVAAGCRK